MEMVLIFGRKGSWMKTKVLLAAAMAWFLCIVGCGDEEAKRQLAIYLNQDIMTVVQLEEAALKDYSSVTGENYTNDHTLYEVLREKVIPNYSRFVNLLEKLELPNDDLMQLHSTYVRGAHSCQTGFALLLAAIEKQDPQLVQRANKHIVEGRQRGEQWQKEFIDLCQKKGVKVIFKKDEASAAKTKEDKHGG